MFSNKKIIVILVAVILTGAGLYFGGINWFKKNIGYNVPPIETPRPSGTGDAPLSFLKLPDGFKINIFAEDLENPRVIAFDPAGRIFVSETKTGKIVMLKDSDNDGESEDKI